MARTGEKNMAIREYETESQLDDAFGRLEELQFEHLALQEAVKNKQRELEEAEDDLRCFEEDHKGQLLAP
jgi:TolA-binding protein